MAITIDRKALDRRFQKLIKNMKDTNSLRRLGFLTIETIRDRTRNDGKGVARPGGNRVRLKPVSAAWAERRKKFNRHPKAASGSKSNLTFKGTMLDSMVIRKASGSKLIIGFKNSKESDKAEGNEAMGRPFMYLGRAEIRDAATFIRKNILKGI